MTECQITGFEELKADFQGQLLLPGQDGYEEARQVWNAMIDRRPALIARAADTKDVARAVQFAREQGLPLSVRGGGHNITGSAVRDDGLMIDLSRMTGVQVDAAARRATVEGGATLADLDRATQAHGLATPVGINSTTGIGGLTLGGGFGWLSRRHGMTVDNLESAEVVLADGQIVRADATHHPELFWGLRGGGGNFGVVTRFEFRLHLVGPQVLSGLIVYPLAEAAAVLRRYRAFMAEAPDELTVWAVLRQAPPLPFLPPAVHGQGVLVLALMYAGDAQAGAALVDPLRTFGHPVGEHVGVQPFTAWQQAFDPLLTPGARNYWKSHNLPELSDGLIDTVVGFADGLPSPQCEIFVAALGGATMRPAPGDAAYPHRDARFVMNAHARWAGFAEEETSIAWARDLFQATAPFSTGGVYVNFLTMDQRDGLRAAYGANYDRLARVKRRYDPDNLFNQNHNITPA